MKFSSAFYLASAAVGLSISTLAFADGYDITAGAGIALTPRYLGDNEYHFVPVPLLNVTTPSGIYVDTTRGIGYKLTLPHNFYIDATLNYAIGRKDSNQAFGSGSDTLRGMGDVPNALFATITAGYRFANMGSISLAADTPLSNRSIGDAWRAAFEAPVFMSGSDVLTAKSVVHFGSQKYNQTMWGVNASQSANSGFRQYSPGGGFDTVDFGLTWVHQFDRRWSVSTSGQLTRLVGDAADSPIVKRRVSANVATIVGYTF
jgi:MipA family protein